ncbi:class I SAM-dependent methyltransferase [Flexithrix dorotheae]|uniref:class I SAM-dependent methyltransferase n=1 Tax=Flexithrix dorotheae TaxID=70993 RepID=UPI0003686E73|nr:class I SAM-dependent methyltransferase [Flexithrix dorotheae]
MKTSAKQHYEHHLAKYYTWSLGDLKQKQDFLRKLIELQDLAPKRSRVCIDLGAGSGLHTIPLAQAGFAVKAIDFSRKLLTELSEKSGNMDIECIEADIRNIHHLVPELDPELVVCAGDTLTHLGSVEEVKKLLTNCCNLLERGGKMLLSFRDYTKEPKGTNRVIPVRCDDTRIHNCLLEFGSNKVLVSDLFHENTDHGWVQKVNTYEKIRLNPENVVTTLEKASMGVVFHQKIQGMDYLIGEK